MDSKEIFQKWVKPKLPTTLGEREWLPLPSTDMIFAVTFLTWVYPGPLDPVRLEHSLALALRDYPHCAGRLCFDADSSQWRINLTNDAIPITWCKTQHPGIFTPEFRDSCRTELCDDIAVPSENHKGILPTPLVKFRVTSWETTGETSLTLSYTHILGDGASATGLVQSWSRYYQGLYPLKIPTYEKYINPEPIFDQERIGDAIKHVSFLERNYSYEEYAAMYDRMILQSTRINMKFSSEQINAIWKVVAADVVTKISPLDALAAYLIHSIQAVADIPINKIQQIIGFRNVGVPKQWGDGNNENFRIYSPPPATSVGNSFMIVSAKDSLKPDQSIAQIAAMIRGTIIELRDPATFQNVYAAYTHFFKESLKLNRIPWEWPTETTVQINNLAKFPWLEVDFGYTGRTRIFDWDACENFIEILPASPVKISNDQWRTFEGGVDVSLRLKHHLEAPFLRIVQHDMKSLSNDTWRKYKL